MKRGKEMEQKAMLLGIELVDFTNDKGEQIKFTKFHLMDSNASEASNTFVGRRVATLNTTKLEKSWYDMVGHEVYLMYELRLGSKRPTFSGMKLAQVSK